MTEIQITPKWKDVKPDGHYVYVHRRYTDGIVFYVGKGNGRRAWDLKRYYNKYWINTSIKHGITVEIIKDGMNKECAFTFEQIMIQYYGVENLTNLTTGGEGVRGILGEQNHRYDATKYKFWHDDYGFRFCTKYKLSNDFNLRPVDLSNLCSGKALSTKGWVLY